MHVIILGNQLEQFRVWFHLYFWMKCFILAVLFTSKMKFILPSSSQCRLVNSERLLLSLANVRSKIKMKEIFSWRIRAINPTNVLQGFRKNFYRSSRKTFNETYFWSGKGPLPLGISSRDQTDSLLGRSKRQLHFNLSY